MVKVVIGDMFTSDAQTFVNTVNCVGVMGKGIALQFKNAFPDIYEEYVRLCDAGEFKLGIPHLHKRAIRPWVLNFPTKDHWRSVSKLEDIIKGLEYLEKHYKEWEITSLAVPPLGCGQGQLEWRVVGPTLYRHLKKLDIPVQLFAPYGTPHEELQPTFLDGSSNGSKQSIPQSTDSLAPLSRVPAGWIALIKILAQVEHEPHHWAVGRTSFQKIAYFATELGIPTGLEYHKGSYGPFAGDLKGQIAKLANNGLIKEVRLGSMFAVQVGETFADACRAYEPELLKWGHQIDRITDLFVRMQTHQAELAATVHFAAQVVAERLKSKPTEIAVLSEVMKWKQKRRPALKDQEVSSTIRHLRVLGWLDVTTSSNLPLNDKALLDV
jgi:uncharacterized protein YwgA/O-acetyl-ADP-ribose deacetylase (regulator of RNase III)